MTFKEWLSKWDMGNLQIQPAFLDREWTPRESDRNAAWSLYVELLTRFAPRPLSRQFGDEQTALESIHALFPLTRQVIKENGRDCMLFTKVAVVVLNQVVRPFVAKWHGIALSGGFEQPKLCDEFGGELLRLQGELQKYTRMLADMAGVEDLTSMEVV